MFIETRNPIFSYWSMEMKDVKINGAKSIVMQPLFASKTEVDRKKNEKLMRKQKHKGKFDY